MGRYIFGRRNLIHIVNLEETLKGMVVAYHFVRKIVSRGQLPLFVGTKRQAGPTIKEEALKCGCPYVIERWVGGRLTNYGTIRKRLERLRELEEAEASGAAAELSKKELSRVRREKTKLLRNLKAFARWTGFRACSSLSIRGVSGSRWRRQTS